LIFSKLRAKIEENFLLYNNYAFAPKASLPLKKNRIVLSLKMGPAGMIGAR